MRGPVSRNTCTDRRKNFSASWVENARFSGGWALWTKKRSSFQRISGKISSIDGAARLPASSMVNGSSAPIRACAVFDESHGIFGRSADLRSSRRQRLQCRARSNTRSERAVHDVDAATRAAFARGEHFGIVWLVARAGTIVRLGAFGELRQDSIVRLASLTKPIVAAGLMALCTSPALLMAGPKTRPWRQDASPPPSGKHVSNK